MTVEWKRVRAGLYTSNVGQVRKINRLQWAGYIGENRVALGETLKGVMQAVEHSHHVPLVDGKPRNPTPEENATMVLTEERERIYDILGRAKLALLAAPLDYAVKNQGALSVILEIDRERARRPR